MKSEMIPIVSRQHLLAKSEQIFARWADVILKARNQFSLIIQFRVIIIKPGVIFQVT